MPHSFGKYARTRHLLAKPFRKKGLNTPTKALEVVHVNDYVDLVYDQAVSRGMHAKCYQGKTGRVFTVHPRGIGVIIRKRVRHRYIDKKIYVRHEHVRKNKAREDFKKRVQEHMKNVAEAKAKGETYSFKRIPPQPREAHVVPLGEVEYVNPLRGKDTF